MSGTNSTTRARIAIYSCNRRSGLKPSQDNKQVKLGPAPQLVPSQCGKWSFLPGLPACQWGDIQERPLVRRGSRPPNHYLISLCDRVLDGDFGIRKGSTIDGTGLMVPFAPGN
jgi:hypothetical protein